MYCPNCGANNQFAINYCRSCGLKLDEISQNVAEQFPSDEYAALIRRKGIFEKLGVATLSITAVIALSMIFYKAGAYKAELFGEAALMWAAFAAFALFGLLAVFFFNYPKLFMKFDKINPRLEPNEQQAAIGTPKLIEDRAFQPASVTEHSTELLRSRRSD